MAKAKNYFAWQGRLVRPHLGHRVIEVGCGIGNFTSMLLDRDAVFALDIEAGCIEVLRNRYAGCGNLRAFVGEPGTKPFEDLRRERPDTCVCLNVLEHIENDGKALESMAAVLQPGGKVILIVPAFPSLFGPIDRNLEHIRRYRRDDLSNLAQRTGLVVEVSRFWNLVGFFGWWWNSHVGRRERQSAAQIALFDRAVVPLMSRLERLLPPPFGQSLFAVLRKPQSSDT